MSAMEGLATALGLLYLILAIRERRACWIPGGLASALFLVVFWGAALPMQALLQIYYIAIAIHGWLHWGRAGALTPVQRVGLRYHLTIIVLWSALSIGTQLLRDALYDPQAWLDTVTSWGGVLATWMVARRKLEAWLYWVLIDLATTALYLQAGLLASSGLYGIYTLLAISAWVQWRTSYRQHNGISSTSSA